MTLGWAVGTGQLQLTFTQHQVAGKQWLELLALCAVVLAVKLPAPLQPTPSPGLRRPGPGPLERRPANNTKKQRSYQRHFASALTLACVRVAMATRTVESITSRPRQRTTLDTSFSFKPTLSTSVRSLLTIGVKIFSPYSIRDRLSKASFWPPD